LGSTGRLLKLRILQLQTSTAENTVAQSISDQQHSCLDIGNDAMLQAKPTLNTAASNCTIFTPIHHTTPIDAICNAKRVAKRH
jgi:hypothetical protein